VLAATMADPDAKALFIFPTNPLANDQEESLQRLLAQLPESVRPRAPIRLQGSMGAEKGRLAATDPQLVLTNPEMVHLHLLPQHRRWERFWRGLKYIVVDEIHYYRGAFGGHLANLLRRVRRCAWRYGAKPQMIAASATVGNPQALAEELCAAPFSLVDRSGAPRGERTTVLWRPPLDEEGNARSYVDESVELFRKALDAGLQTILFARSRQQVEAMVSRLEAATKRTRVALGVRAYRGGYLREEREVIEQGLRGGTVRGVVTTNALEVGIDIGSLDVCIIAGYPGTVTATRQQSGRVGRRDRGSAVFMVESPNPLDTYLFHHPELLLDAESERAVVGRLNAYILRSHLLCAANEFPLWDAEIERFGGEGARKIADHIVDIGLGRWEQEQGRRVLSVPTRTHYGMSLRSASQDRLSLVDPDGEVIGELERGAAMREAHPGAIYLHQGRVFRVERHEERSIVLALSRPGISTRVRGERAVTLNEVRQKRKLAKGGAELFLAEVEVTDQYSSYLESRGAGKPISRPIEPPIVSQLKTEGLVIRLSRESAAIMRSIPTAPLEAALHGAEHLLSAFASSLVLCDRNDIEGDTLVEANSASIVLFDRYPGGLGFAASAFERADAILARASEAVDGCECETGCPACIHSGHCLRGNDEVSKLGARIVLRLVQGLDPPSFTQRPPTRTRFLPKTGPKPARPHARPAPIADVPSEHGFSLGDAVEHASFGRGEVEETRPGGRVVVKFEDGRSRRIAPGWLRKV
jgi:DEAD/DEAH box helicase domain-containing protein